MSEVTVDIHVPARSTPLPDGPHIDEGLSKYGRAELAIALIDRGMRPLFSRGPYSYDTDNETVTVLDPKLSRSEDGYEVTVTEGIVALNAIDAIRNISKAIGEGVPELNNPAVRAAARDKAVTNIILASRKLAKTFSAWPLPIDIREVLATIPGNEAVLKPREGRMSRNVFVGTKEDIIVKSEAGEFNGGQWVIEERLDLSLPIDVRAIDQENQDKLTYINKSGLPKELRAYTFGRDAAGNVITSYVMRVAAKEGDKFLLNDEWLYIDPTTVPGEVITNTDSAVAAFEEYTGVKEMHIAVDWVYAKRPGQTEAVWLPMEVNASEPQLIRPREHSAISRKQTGLLADQLYRVALRGGTV